MKRLALAISILLSLQIGAAPTQAATTSCGHITLASSNTGKSAILLPCLDGKSTVDFNAIRGPVVVNVWGSWCEPCNQELPYFVKLQATGKVHIVGVDVEERSRKSAQNFVLKKSMKWPNLYDENSITRSLFGLGVPVTWFIDADGRVIYKNIGVMKSQKELFSKVKKYLGIAA
jgi:thiol-disulfide isomerase/thioredoxin